MDLNSYFIKSYATGLINLLIKIFVFIFIIPLIIKNIGLEQWGVWSILFIFVGLNSTFNFGLSNSIIYFLPKTNNSCEQNKIYTANRIINYISVLLIFCFVGLAYIFDIFYLFKFDSVDHDMFIFISFSGLLILTLLILTSPYRAVLEAYLRYDLVQIGYIIQTLLLYPLILIVVNLDGKAREMIIITVLIYIFIFLYHNIIHKNITHIKWVKPSIQDYKKILKYSFSVYLGSFIWSLINPLNKLLVLFQSDNTSSIAKFDISLRIGILAFSILSIFSRPLLALLSKNIKVVSNKNQYLIYRSTFLIICLAIAGNLIFFFLGPWYFKFFIDYKLIDELLFLTLIFMIGLSILAISEPYKNFLYASGKTRVIIIINIMFIIFNLIIFSILSYKVIELRVALSYSISAILISFITIAYVHISIKKNYDGY